MDFPIQLDLSEGAEQIQLTVRAESGQFQTSVPLPFAPDDLSILTRALELSTGMSVQRTFEVAEVERLKNLGLLIRSPAVSEGMSITGVDLDLEGLRELVRARLSAVLSACKSALGRRGGDVFNGIAQCLMQSVPAVIASPFPLDDQGAQKFAHGFYQELGNCGTLAPALYHVRNRMLPAFPNEWYRPVLYLRAAQDDGGCLLDCETLRCRAAAVSVQTRTGPDRPTPEAVFTVDFAPQEEEFHRCIKAHCGRDSTGNPNPRSGRPMVFIVPGWTDSATAH